MWREGDVHLETSPSGLAATQCVGWPAGLLVALSDGLDRITEACYVTATAAFASVMLLGVFFRYVMNNSLFWSDEMAVIFFVWAIFLSISSGYLHGKHVNIDFFMRRVRVSWRRRLEVVAEGIAGGYLVSLLVSSLDALRMVERSHTDALQVPMTAVYLAIPVASGMMLVHWARLNSVGATVPSVLVKLIVAFAFFVVAYLPLGLYIQLSSMLRLAALAVTFVVPLVLGVPVAFSLGALATLHVAVIGVVPFNTAALQMFMGIESVVLMAVPLLILSGSLMHEAGIAERIVDFSQVLVGRVRGGLAASNVVASFLFGDISGSAVADTAAIGSLMIPEMKRRGYRADFCAALQGAAGTLGMTAPLSITLIMYATAIGASVSRMAAATIIPAILLGSSFMIGAIVIARRHGYPSEHVPREVIVPRILRAIPGVSALALIVGGVIGGIFTPAEVGSILLFYVLLLSVLLYRTMEPGKVYRTTVRAGYISGMTLFLVATSAFLGFMFARDHVSDYVVSTMAQISTNRYMVLFLVSAVFVVLGMVLEAPAMIYGFLPSFMPMITQAGIDVVHWGVLFVLNTGLGMLVPPVAVNLFISTEIAGTSYEKAVRAAVPFMLIMVVDMVLVAVFPHISLLVPNILFGYPIR